ncbi:MAG: alpha-glucan family phosphorylase [Gammaproteobacteria bacterium]
MHPSRYLPRGLPGKLQGLAELAVDLRWDWNHSADQLWKTVDEELWAATGNPWLILESVSGRRLEELARDSGFRAELDRQVKKRRDSLSKPTWCGGVCKPAELGTVAYFSMEFGLSESLPIYSGGLGVLAGDLLKTASDLGVPVAGVGLLYQQGYFRQALDASGNQLAFNPYNNPTMLPVMPLRDPDGEWLRVTVELPGRTLHLRAWQVHVGRSNLYLLDSNDLLNSPGDRSITSELYGGGAEMRLQQEMVLGIGGWRLLQALDLSCPICHLNEGHAAFAVLERARAFAQRTGQPFSVALRCTRAGNLFTTHTPVAAGFDRFDASLMTQYLGEYAKGLGISMNELLALGRADPGRSDEPFNMAYLAVRGSAAVNGVSRLHGEVSRELFQPLFAHWPQSEVPIGHVTNGVHMPSWDSAAADAVWTDAAGKERWLGTMETLEQDLRAVDDRELWELRAKGRQALIEAVRLRLARQAAARAEHPLDVDACTRMLDPNTLVLGFARRFATYKRPNLLLHDRRRLVNLLTDPERPVQLIVAGKAHPRDDAGKAMVRAWAEFSRDPAVRGRVVFVEDYDMALAAELVQGVDLWINTPRRPWEASGTSGMKVLVNGGLNLSELDGWWAEAYGPELGWALGDRQRHGDDPAWDAEEAGALYDLLEREVVPAFYARDEHGMPTEWVARMRESMARLTPLFSSNRMVREYTERYYLPGAAAYRSRAQADGRAAHELEAWIGELRRQWPALHFGELSVETADGRHHFRIPVYFSDLDPGNVRVELYADRAGDEQQDEHIAMTRGEALAGAVNGYLFEASVPTARAADDYTPRIIPARADALIPLEVPLIVWQR